MNGKLEGFKDDTIHFNFQGNKLKFKTSDIVSIYFDEKSASNDLNKSTITNEIIASQEGRIFGVVTYFFNDNYGDKPDVGAEVYIVDSVKIQDFNFATVDSFFNSNTYRSYKSMWMQRPSQNKTLANIIEEAKKYDLDRKGFISLDERAAKNISKILENKNVKKSVVDGSGNYFFKVKAGTYYVYIKSKGRTGSNISEASGKIKCEKLIVKEDDDINMSYDFSFELKR